MECRCPFIGRRREVAVVAVEAEGAMSGDVQVGASRHGMQDADTHKVVDLLHELALHLVSSRGTSKVAIVGL